MLQSRRLGLCLSALIGVGLLGKVSAQQPGALASPNEKLDHLFTTWQGKSLDRLHDVWGKEKSIDLHRGTRVFVYERYVKVRAAGLGVQVFGGNGVRCVGQFEVDDKNQIVRTYWQAGGVRECWSAFRRYEP